MCKVHATTHISDNSGPKSKHYIRDSKIDNNKHEDEASTWPGETNLDEHTFICEVHVNAENDNLQIKDFKTTTTTKRTKTKHNMQIITIILKRCHNRS